MVRCSSAATPSSSLTRRPVPALPEAFRKCTLRMDSDLHGGSCGQACIWSRFSFDKLGTIGAARGQLNVAEA